MTELLSELEDGRQEHTVQAEREGPGERNKHQEGEK